MNCNDCHTNYGYEEGEVKLSDYNSEVQPTWCSGCGDYAIWAAIKRAMVELNIPTHEVLFCFDIGCNGNMSDKIKGYRVHSLHGRVLPLAAGAKLANPNVKVIAFAGDGATYSEGINHFINTIRNNYPITLLVHNNGNYGLTTGQASATTHQGAARNASPYGPAADTLNPVHLALSLGAPFVARGFSGNIPQMVEIFKEAMLFQDKGLSYVDILQTCPTYNKEMTNEWYFERVKDFKNERESLNDALEISKDQNTNIATGVLYRNDDSINFFDRAHYDSGMVLSEQVQKFNVDTFVKDLV
jgi:2-oxoglutarate ferredoxin oxidoreductase subunit beta